MRMDGKSASEIDAMKSAYRKQMFNPDGYSQAAGLGSFASGGEAYGPPPVKGPDPQGIGENIRMADGGEVMNGIGTLNETARNMTRGPRGIGAYQQFADGGGVQSAVGGDSFGGFFKAMQLGHRMYSNPVDSLKDQMILTPPNQSGGLGKFQTPDPIGLPRGIGSMGDQQMGPKPLAQYGQYLEQTYGQPDFEQKRNDFLNEVSEKERQTFGQDQMGPSGGLGSMGPSSDFFGRSQLENIYGGGKFSMDTFADGGPVYMKNAGSVEVAARRASNEDLDNLSAMIKANYGFDPVAVALEQGIDPELALRVMYEESKGKQSAGSEKGARGLMQLMPGTAKELGVNIDDALENYTGGLRYLKKMTNQFGLELGLAAYNAGPGNVEEYGGVPPFKETQNYLRIIAEPFTGNSVEEIINTGSENFIMNQPVFNEEDVARGRGVRPPERPLSIDQQYYQGIIPQPRPEGLDPAMDLNPKVGNQGVEVALQEALQEQSMAEKYSAENMAQQLGAPQMRPRMRPPVGIMSAIR